MKVIEPMTRYGLDGEQELVFLARDESTGMVTRGTTNEEVLEVVLDRLRGQNRKVGCRDNSLAITHIEDALLRLGNRIRKRSDRVDPS